MWFVGAALLVAGNVIIGRRDEGVDKDGQGGHGSGEGQYVDSDGDRNEGSGESGVLLGESVGLDEAENEDLEAELERKKRQDEDDILQLGSDTEEEG